MKIGVTGSTGALGNLVIDHLISEGADPSSIVAIARNLEKAAPLKEKGVECRFGDYTQPDSLVQAFTGIDRLVLISANEIGKREEQHRNIVESAGKAGIKLLVYTSLFRADSSVSPLAGEHVATEKMIKNSRIPYVILRNNWYTDNYNDDALRAKETGMIEAAAGYGKIASASRSDYAEAAAKVVREEGHENRIYELAGTPWDLGELAGTVSEILGREVNYLPVDGDTRMAHLKEAGLPEAIASFVTGLDTSIKEGALEGTSPDLEKLLGRRPESMKEYFKRLLG